MTQLVWASQKGCDIFFNIVVTCICTLCDSKRGSNWALEIRLERISIPQWLAYFFVTMRIQWKCKDKKILTQYSFSVWVSDELIH